MRKNYVKPELFYESFVLSQHIAGCSLQMPGLSNGNECIASGTVSDGYQDIYLTNWFTTTNTSCALEPEGYCYTNGTVNAVNMNS